MRNYLYQKLAEQKDRFAQTMRQLIKDRLLETLPRQMNAKRGTITGEGTVRGSHILGDVQIGKDAVLANSIVDQKVTLIIEEGVQITDCAFHPYVNHHNSETVPTEIRIGKNSAMSRMYISIPTVVGENCTIVWGGFNLNRQDYSAQGLPEGVEIGANAVMYNVYLDANKGRDPKTADTLCKCKVGQNAFIVKGKLKAINGMIELGDDSVICDCQDILACIQGTLKPVLTPLETQPIEIFRNAGDMDGLCSVNTDATIGKQSCICMDLYLEGAFEKTKRGSFSFGDKTVMMTGTINHHMTTAPTLYAHTFKTGESTTLCATGDGWYSNNFPLRDVEVGDNSVIRMQVRREGQLIGPDIKVPKDSVVVI